MKLQRSLSLTFLSGALLLASCNQNAAVTEPAGVVVKPVTGTGDATLSADVVRSNRGVAVEGSKVYLYKTGDRSVAVGEATTNAQGYVEFAKIPAGRYDLVFMKSKAAGSEFNGAVAKSGMNTRLKVAQFASADPNATADVPQLKLQTPTGYDDKGEATGWKDLTAGVAFNNTVDVRAYTVQNSTEPRIMRFFLFSLVTIDKDGTWADVRPAAGLYEQDPGYILPGVDPSGKGQGQDSGLVSLDPTGLKGDVYLQVVGLDFNYNRVAYLVPLTINRTAAAKEVVAPTNVRAVSYTLSTRIDYLYGTQNPGVDAPTSGTNLWVTTSWDTPVDVSGVTGFRVLRSTQATGPYSQVAFAGAAQCPKPADAKATVRRCTVNDNTASLVTGQDYFYKVVAVGSNEAASDAAPTYTLPLFQPKLLSPGKDVHDVELTPNYTIKANLFGTGATGAVLNVRVADFVTGESYGYVARRLTLRKGFDAAGKEEVQILSNLLKTDNYYVFRDSWATDNDPKTENGTVKYDAASDVLTIPHQYEADLLGSAKVELQTNRRYSWYINEGYAYRLADPTKPASATNYVAAYSVYSDPSDTVRFVPGGVKQGGAEVNDFTTRP
ncbi:hypothetical protein WDJ50_17295 [Deinococcus sp. VB142]|uniref:Fibronectin type-III domain-containing protein n=1 Tax=Deinococcus sp. VB142 TaxID=3112952 RepID=A0AAU6Q7A8_9DEIO